MASERPTPEEFFAAEGGPRNVCKVCIHPDRPEIDRGLSNGVGALSMARWINAYTETPVKGHQVSSHLNKGHHQKEK